MESTDFSSASDPWYVVYCKARKELYAANALHNQLGLTVYLPEIEIHQRREIQRVPLFSGYFFVQVNLQRVELSRINSNPNVLRLLDFGDGPLSVPHTLIDMLRKEISRHSICSDLSHQKLSPGDPVRVTNGPLEGLRAVFIEPLTSGERACVLLHILGRLSKVQIEISSLENLNTDFSRKERRTRGKGRRINRDHHIA